MQEYLKIALHDADQKGIHGSNTTPFLLQRLSELTNGLSLKANLDLLINNARIATKISKILITHKR